MSISFAKETTVNIQLRGSLDAAAITRLENVVASQLDLGARRIVLNLRDVPALPAENIPGLINLARRCRSAGCNLHLAHLPPPAQVAMAAWLAPVGTMTGALSADTNSQAGALRRLATGPLLSGS